MTIRRTLLAVAVFALAAPLFAASPQKAGKWQMTMQMEMPGMPVKMPPVTTSHCVTEEDVKNAESAVPQGQSKDCKINDLKIEGKTVTYNIECPKQKMTGSGKVTYTDESFDGLMKVKMNEQEVTTKMTGKYLGACDSK